MRLKQSARTGLLAGAAALVALIAWHGNLWLLPCAILLIPLWAMAENRVQAGLIALAYYLVAARCIPALGATFWALPGQPAILKGYVAWLVSGALLALAWSLCWGEKYKPIRAILAVCLITLPPLGIIGWTSPLTAAGVIFPGLGWLGLLLATMLIAALAWRDHRALLLIAVAGILSAIANTSMTPTTSPHWMAINTAFGSGRDRDTEYDRLIALDANIAETGKQLTTDSIILLPEGVIADWHIGRDYLGRGNTITQTKRIIVLIGAQQMIGQQLINGIYALSSQDKPAWINRIPVPAGLWKPFGTVSAPIHLLDNGVVQIGHTAVGSLICYEQLIPWPALISRAAGAQVFIAPSNLWFAKKTSLAGIQRTSAEAWARLFSMPILFANNM